MCVSFHECLAWGSQLVNPSIFPCLLEGQNGGTLDIKEGIIVHGEKLRQDSENHKKIMKKS